MESQGRPRTGRGLFFLAAVVSILLTRPAAAQPASADTLRLAIDDAVGVALRQSPVLQLVRLEVEEARVRVAEAAAVRRPQLSANASYTRELASQNPFAGTPALGMFGTQAPTEWLFWNERARTDGNPATEPLPLEEFRSRQEAAVAEAGGAPAGGENPFAVENRFQLGLSFTQALLDGAARAEQRAAQVQFAAAQARAYADAAAAADTVRQAYLAAVLATGRAQVLERSAARAAATAAEAARRVEQGVAPVAERLGAEVEQVNVQTEWIEAAASAASALDLLKFVIGVPQQRPVVLVDALAIDDAWAAADERLDVLLEQAVALRPDLQQARLAREAQQARADAARARRRPSLALFADATTIGNVPDSRTVMRTDPLEPFDVQRERRGFLSGDFWDFGANVGVRMAWDIYAGGRLRAQAEAADVAVAAADVQLELARERARLEVAQALRDARSAAERARLQEANVERAARNYEQVAARVAQGVATPLERRDASEQLDRSRLNLVQARHDYLAARSALRLATGRGVEAALLAEWQR